jgi:hypothetical protein
MAAQGSHIGTQPLSPRIAAALQPRRHVTASLPELEKLAITVPKCV